MAGLVRGHKGLVYPTNFAVSSDTATVQIGYPYHISYTITPANATNQIIKWTSSNNNIATVDSKGIITAVSIGTCTVTGIYTYDNTTVTIAVTTTEVHTTGITLDKNSLLFDEGDSIFLHATVAPSNTSYPGYTWSTSDANIASVTNTGLVKYIGEGICTITATTVDGGFTATCSVVCITHVTGVSLDIHSVTLEPGDTQQLTATVSPSAATYPSVTWKSSNASVATVSSTGLVTYVSDGECVITVTATDGGFTDSCNVSCVVPVTGVTLNYSSGEVKPETPLQLVATIAPSDATHKDVTWSSSNTSVATVDGNGLVTYVGDGDATITCTTVDGGYTATCGVTCISVQPVSKTFTYTGADQSYTIPYTQCYKLEAWGAGSYDAYGGYASGITCLTKGTKLKIMVGAKGNNSGNQYGFGGASNYSNCYNGGGLSGIFSGDSAIGANDSSRAMVIGGGAGSCSGRGNGGAGGGTSGNSGGTSGYGTQGGGGTQTGHGSTGNSGNAQFCGGPGSRSYGAGGGGGWWGGNGTYGDGSGWDDKGAGGGSGYVLSTYTSRTLTTGGGAANQSHGCVKISSV